MITTFQIIQIAIPILAIVLNLIFRYIDKKKTNLFYIIRNRVIIENKLNDENITVSYKNTKTEKLLQTEILIFNKSGSVIKYEELGATIGLQIAFSDSTNLYELEITEYNNPNVNLTYNQEKSKIKLFFDYFKNENYVLLKFLTNEMNSKKPELLGEFMNNNKILKFNLTRYLKRETARFFPHIMISAFILINMLNYFKIKEATQYIILLLSGSLLISIFQKIMNKKFDKRIKDLMTV
jgi:hypothetical protein